MSKIKKVIAYFLSGLVLLFCIIAILGIWDIIDLENLLSRMFQSMMVILAASAVIVFIFAIMLKDYRRDEDD
jgi:heme/copper-type cytochrome/quinol oxidase subunit 2